MFSNQLPAIFSILFLLAFLFPVCMVALLAQKGGIKNGFALVLGYYIAYLSLVAYASLNGFYDDVMLPPKIVITTTLPFALFLAIIFNTNIVKKATDLLQVEDLVKVHIFRLIGSTFILLFIYQLLPHLFALLAGIGDVLTAISSIFVVKAIRNNNKFARRLTFFWNTFGLLDILLTSALAIIFTKISIDNGTLGVEFLANFPFCFIPAFAPPTIIFLHLLVYRKLSSNK